MDPEDGSRSNLLIDIPAVYDRLVLRLVETIAPPERRPSRAHPALTEEGRSAYARIAPITLRMEHQSMGDTVRLKLSAVRFENEWTHARLPIVDSLKALASLGSIDASKLVNPHPHS